MSRRRTRGAQLRRIEQKLNMLLVRLIRIEAALSDPIFEQPEPWQTPPANVVPFKPRS